MLSSFWSLVNIISELILNWKILISIILTIYLGFWLLKPKNIYRNLEDVGYDHLFENQRLRNSKKRKAEIVSEARKNRDVGDLPPVFPNGWFGLLESNEVSAREVKYVSALGEHFAVFRGENGKINIVSAYCPHLGANIALGGTVAGNCLECPFHGWKFDGNDGSCVSIPYSKSIPAESKLKCWPCCEVNTFIFVWYHAENEEPSWLMETIPKIHYGEWWYRGRTEHYFNSHIQNFMENIADSPHLAILHGSFIFSGNNIDKNHWLNKAITHPFQTKWIWPVDEKKPHIGLGQITGSMNILNKFTLLDSSFNAEQIGPGFIVVKSKSPFGQTMSIFSATPIEPLLVKVVHKIFYPFSSLIYATLYYHSARLLNSIAIKMNAILISTNYFYTWCTCSLSQLTNWKFCATILTIYTLYRFFKFKHVVKELGDIGYDHLAKTKKIMTWNKKIKPKTVAEARKRRPIGNVPPVYPNGWFFLLDSNQISAKQIKYESALGEDFAIFRGEDGIVNIVSAICPHLGANIAIGGTVSGNCIECPFHGWKFDGITGECISIPYSKTVPAESKLRKWLSHETNDCIYVWYHVENEKPTWYPRDIPEIRNRVWRYAGRVEHYINVHLQDVYENFQDETHLSFVHSSISSWLPAKMEYTNFAIFEEGEKRHTFTAKFESEFKLLNRSLFRIGVKNTCEGPGISIATLRPIFGSVLLSINITPVEPLLVKFVVKGFYPFSAFFHGHIEFFAACSMLENDIAIWNHKKYQDKPLLTKEEDSIKKFRRWYSQFYSENSPRLERNNLEW